MPKTAPNAKTNIYLDQYREGRSVAEIAQVANIKEQTVLGHIATAIENGILDAEEVPLPAVPWRCLSGYRAAPSFRRP